MVQRSLDVIIEIRMKNGEALFTENGDLENVKAAVEGKIPLDCFWFGSNGQRFDETHIFMDDDLVVFIRTDSDAMDRRRI